MINVQDELAQVIHDYGNLTFTEALFLYCLLEKKGRVVTYDSISQTIFDCSGSRPSLPDLSSYKKRMLKRMIFNGWRVEIIRISSVGWKLMSIEKTSEVLAKIDQEFLSDHENGVYGDCFRACVRSLLGLTSPNALPHSIGPDGNWNPDFIRELETKYFLDIRFKVYRPERNLETLPRVVIAAGPTIRGTNHAVLWDRIENKMIHDPHPSRAGLEKIEMFYYLAGA